MLIINPQNNDSIQTINHIVTETDSTLKGNKAQNKKDSFNILTSENKSSSKTLKKDVGNLVNNPNPITQKDSALQTSITRHEILIPYAAAPANKSNNYENIIIPFDTLPKGLMLIAIDKKAKPTFKLKHNYIKGLFTGHGLHSKQLEPITRVVNNGNWFSIQLVFVFFMLASLRAFYQKRFSLVLVAFVNQRYASQIFREENILTQRTSVLLSLMFVVSVSLFFYQLDELYHFVFINYSGFKKYLSILSITLIFYSVKIILNKISGFIFKCEKETSEYIFNQFLILQIAGLGLMIVVLFWAYAKEIQPVYFVYAGLSVLAAGFLVRLYRSSRIISNNMAFSSIYIFLYLCTLEILPVIIISKYLMR